MAKVFAKVSSSPRTHEQIHILAAGGGGVGE